MLLLFLACSLFIHLVLLSHLHLSSWIQKKTHPFFLQGFRSSLVVGTTSEERIEYAAWACLLNLLGCTVFDDKTGTWVSVEYLYMLYNLQFVQHICVGSCGSSIYVSISWACLESSLSIDYWIFHSPSAGVDICKLPMATPVFSTTGHGSTALSLIDEPTR